jgi:hypothetical protein
MYRQEVHVPATRDKVKKRSANYLGCLPPSDDGDGAAPGTALTNQIDDIFEWSNDLHISYRCNVSRGHMLGGEV